METKKYHAKPEKAEKIYENLKHFGWEIESNENNKLILVRDNKRKGYHVLKKLEKQSKMIKQIIPFKVILCAILTALFIALYSGYCGSLCIDGKFFGLIDLNELVTTVLGTGLEATLILKGIPIVLILFAGILAAMTAAFLVNFIAIKISGKRILKEIYHRAGVLSGVIVDAPLKANIAKPNSDSGILEKAKI